MAYDGIVINNLISDIREACLGGRVMKIQQPKDDTITLTIKGNVGQTKLLLSVNNSLPIVYIADSLPQAPMQAPNFCMLLRKHLGNGRLKDIVQPGFDRVFDFIFEHLDEMGDLCERHLIVEIMGRQSNIILTNSDGVILDCLRRVMPDLGEVKDESKMRILYPNKVYISPDSQNKLNPLEVSMDAIMERLSSVSVPVAKAIYTSISGFSKGIAEEIVYRADIDGRKAVKDLDEDERLGLHKTFSSMIDSIKNSDFKPAIAYSMDQPKDYHSFELSIYGASADGSSISDILRRFYSEKEASINVRSLSSDIRKHLQTDIERISRKYDLQRNQLASTEDRDKYRIYGELLNTYGYELKGGEDHLDCINYYDNTEISIPLDTNLSAQENSQKYYKKYNKKKRTYEALTEFIKQTKEEMDYLLSVRHALDIAVDEKDINEIRTELENSGFLRKKTGKKGSRKTESSKPLHFISSDGYDIYVGKNNIQNEELTFNMATGRDLWFHAKQMPGSHVIVRLKDGDKGIDDVPDRVFEEAAGLAAFYSSGSDAPKVEIDYVERKQLKKPPGAKPGYVIYHTNYSMMAEPKCDICHVED